MDTNPYFWGAMNGAAAFSQFLNQVLPFLNSILLLNQLNQLVVIATGVNSCDYLYDSSRVGHESEKRSTKGIPGHSLEILQKLEDFIAKDQQLSNSDEAPGKICSLLSGSLSLALCYIQRILRTGPVHPQPRILCLQASPDGSEQYVAIMNAIFSAQRSMVPIDSCVVGSEDSAFLQQMVFATDLHSRRFLKLPTPTGVDFRASCFCHKEPIGMGYVCSVCLSIFCKYHTKCSTCGLLFVNQVIVLSLFNE
ncbi:hypothetical protein AMTRI_Chr04g246610 [Amborella trichopoda]